MNAAARPARSAAAWLLLLSTTGCAGGITSDSEGARGNEGSGNGSAGSGGGDGPPLGSNPDEQLNGDPAGAPVSESPPCTIRIRPLSAPALSSLPAGPGRTLTVRGEPFGSAIPTTLDWHWIAFTNGAPITVTSSASDPAMATVPIESPGTYQITVVASGCQGQVEAHAVPPEQRSSFYWVRVIPPSNTGLLPHEETIDLRAGVPASHTFEVARGIEVAIDPRRENDLQLLSAVPSYVRLSSRDSTFLQEGRTSTDGGPFAALLRPLTAYDLLVVPDNGWAPRMFPALFAGQPGAAAGSGMPFNLDPGVALAGNVQTGGTTPRGLPGARILLRAGNLPSTLAVSDAAGGFRLNASGGAQGTVFAVEVGAPAGTRLPDLELPATRGIRIPASSARALTASIRYGDQLTANLLLRVARAGDTAVAGVRVTLTADAPIPAAGTLVFEGGNPIALDGKFEVTADTDTAGRLLLPYLPRVRYRLRMSAPAGMDASETVRVLDLTGGDRDAGTIILARKLKISGQLTGAGAAGATVTALPEGSDETATIVTTTDAEGRYLLALDPEREYRLRVVQAGAGRPRRLALGNLSTGTADMILPARRLPESLTLSGLVKLQGQAQAMPGTVIEVYCLSSGPALPDCVNHLQPSVTGAALLGEAVVDSQGRFTLPLPDPGGE